MTDDHNYLQFNKKIKLNFATQVLIHKVDVGIDALVKRTYFDGKADFII